MVALTGYNASGDLGVPPTFYIQRSEQSEHPVVILLHACYGYLPQSTSCALRYPVPTNVPLGGGYDSVEPGWLTVIFAVCLMKSYVSVDGVRV